MTRKAKSVNGAAEPFLRTDGYWGCTWTATLPDGSKKRIVVTGTKDTIVAKRDAKMAELARGEYVAKNKITFGTWVRQWLKDYKQISLSPTTYETYGILVETHVIPKLGEKSLQSIVNNDIQRLINSLSRKLSPSSVKQINSIVKQCFAQATLNRMIPYSPCVGIKLPKMKTKERHAFTDEELRKLVTAAMTKKPTYHNPAMVPALLTIVETGCRRGEALGLKRDNLDVADCEVLIKDTVVQVHGKPLAKDDPKNTSSIRRLPISKVLMDKLVALDRNGDYVFHTDSGKPISPRNFNRRFAQWCYDARLWDGPVTDGGWEEDKKTGHPTHTPHELRHTFITDLLNNGASIADTQVLTGHATTTALMGYAHAVPESVAVAMEERRKRLDTIFVSENAVVSNVVSNG